MMQRSVKSKRTDVTMMRRGYDQLIVEDDDEANLTTIGDAKIELAELERLVNREEQTTLQPERRPQLLIEQHNEALSEIDYRL